MIKKPIHIDGTTLEGGGQLFRLSLALSSLTSIPIHITDIRGKRGSKSKPGSAGGIKPAHHAGADWLARACHAETEGLKVKSKEITFRPSAAPATSVWKDITIDGQIVRRGSSIKIGTPGSIFLILQTILPWILFNSSPSSSSPSASQQPIPLRLTIEGGTNVWHSLSYEYASQVLFPILHSKLGLGPIVPTLHRRGWSQGRTTVGSITFDITPLAPGKTLPEFEFEERGEIVKLYISVLASSERLKSTVIDRVSSEATRRFPDVDVEIAVNGFSGDEKRLYLLIVAESINVYRLGRDWLFDEKINKEKPQKTVERLVGKVMDDLEMEIGHGGCVDEFLQDQLVVFQTLAEGMSVVEGRRDASLHTKTARWVVDTILGSKFDETGCCEGIGLKAGQLSSKNEDPTSIEEAVASLNLDES